ncbi:MAG TPA: glycosyltransferase family 2 protein [Thermoanaerobaculia bacterium]|nr:glycosyltransferase family 2 protein [Thermoanaerobaculia bacterium]
MLDQITPVILTRDEEANIARTLTQLQWANEVVVVDSLSTDRTIEIATRFPNVRIVQRAFDSLTAQWTFALTQVPTPWLLALDADYFLPDDFIAEIAKLDPPPNVRAYRAEFVYAVHGKRLRASLYPPRIVLLHRDHMSYWQDGHTHRMRVDGDVGDLRAKVIHDDRKTLRRFIQRQRDYMRLEAGKIRNTKWRDLNVAGKIRKLIVVAPFAVLLHTLFGRRLILDGWPGLVYTFERVLAEVILSWELFRSAAAKPPLSHPR